MTQLERLIKLQSKSADKINSYTNEKLIRILQKLHMPYSTDRDTNLEKVLSIYNNRDLLKLHFVSDMATIERRLTSREG